MRSVIASLVSFTALGRSGGFPWPTDSPEEEFPAAMLWRVSAFSLKNFSMSSLSLMILSVMICLRSAELSPPLLSVFADDAELFRLSKLYSSGAACSPLRFAYRV